MRRAAIPAVLCCLLPSLAAADDLIVRLDLVEFEQSLDAKTVHEALRHLGTRGVEAVAGDDGAFAAEDKLEDDTLSMTGTIVQQQGQRLHIADFKYEHKFQNGSSSGSTNRISLLLGQPQPFGSSVERPHDGQQTVRSAHLFVTIYRAPADDETARRHQRKLIAERQIEAVRQDVQQRLEAREIDERAADSLLESIKSLIKDGDIPAAKRLIDLQRKTFPGTRAGREAAEILRKLEPKLPRDSKQEEKVTLR